MRPEARKALGYYPCPPEAIGLILDRLVPPADPTKLSILDCCAGEAFAVKGLAAGLGVPNDKVWLIELDRQRGEACQSNMPGATVLSPCSFLQTDIRTGSFSLCYSNPPFDDSLQAHTRVEEQFLSRVAHLLCVGGVLVFVCPVSIANRSVFQGILSCYFQNIDVIPFPRHVRGHDEVFVLAQRIEGFRVGKPSIRDVMARGNGKYMVPKAPGPGARFKKTGLTDEELEEHLFKSDLMDDFASPPQFAIASPPLALGKGHLALLLAAGHLDGLVSVPGEEHVVRGTARKVEEVADEEVDETKGSKVTKTTFIERIKTVIRAVWSDGLIRTLE